MSIWFTDEVEALCRYKKNLIRQVRNVESVLDIQYHQLMLKRLNNLITWKKRRSKLDYHQRIFQNCDNPFETWKCINKVLHRKPLKQTIDSLKINDIVQTDRETVSNTFNRYFTTVACEMATSFDEKSNIN